MTVAIRRWGRICRERVGEFDLAFGHPDLDVIDEAADRTTNTGHHAASRAGQVGRLQLLCRAAHPTNSGNADSGAHREVEQPLHDAEPFDDAPALSEFGPPRRPRFRSALRSAFTFFCTSSRRRSPTARRSPYENAATLTTGLPRVAANSEVSAETLVVTCCTLVVMASTRSSCWLVRPTVVVTSLSSGTVSSVTVPTIRRASSSTLPSLSSGTASSATNTTNAMAAISPATLPRDIWCSLLRRAA